MFEVLPGTDMPMCSGIYMDETGQMVVAPWLSLALIVTNFIIGYYYVKIGGGIKKSVKQAKGLLSEIESSVRWVYRCFLFCGITHFAVAVGVAHSIYNFFELGLNYFYGEVFVLAITSAIAHVASQKVQLVMSHVSGKFNDQNRRLDDIIAELKKDIKDLKDE